MKTMNPGYLMNVITQQVTYLKIPFRLLALCLIVFATGCSQVTVGYDYDKNTNFADFKTYSWNPVSEKMKPFELTVKRVIVEVNKALIIKRYKEVSTNPDFIINLYGGKGRRMEIIEWGDSYGRRRVREKGGVNIYEYEEATIILDFINPESNELIWRGTASALIDPERTPQEREKLVREAVAKMMENFPPK